MKPTLPTIVDAADGNGWTAAGLTDEDVPPWNAIAGCRAAPPLRLSTPMRAWLPDAPCADASAGVAMATATANPTAAARRPVGRLICAHSPLCRSGGQSRTAPRVSADLLR